MSDTQVSESQRKRSKRRRSGRKNPSQTGQGGPNSQIAQGSTTGPPSNQTGRKKQTEASSNSSSSSNSNAKRKRSRRKNKYDAEASAAPKATSDGRSRRSNRGRSSGAKGFDAKKNRNSKGRGESSFYDLFGAQRSRFSPKEKPYRAEVNAIELPGFPVDLHCAICNQEISEASDILEAFEIQRGEFGTEHHQDSDEDVLPAHFQCVMEALAKTSGLAEGESVAYLGSGKFAVVEGPQRKVKRMIERSAWGKQDSLLSPTNWSKWRQDLNSHALLAALSIETDI